jgi:hypothetical protein
MATQRLRMRQLREILRLLHDARISHRAIARACRVGPTAVCIRGIGAQPSSVLAPDSGGV